VDDELERIWKEAVMPNFKVQPRHSPGGTEDNYEKHARIASLRSKNCGIKIITNGNQLNSLRFKIFH
jgi:hypothetical protein